MSDFILPLAIFLFFFQFELEPNIIPDHSIYHHYTYSFSTEEKNIILFHVIQASKNLNLYVWPTDSSNPKLNNFFKILNSKSNDYQYRRAILYILNLMPKTLNSNQHTC